MRVFTDLKNIPEFRKAVVTIGSFDGVHSGHRGILNQVRTLANACGGESVVVTFDPHPRNVLRPSDLGFKLITTTAEKIERLARCGVDNVVIVPFTHEFAQQSAAQYVEDFLIRCFQPRYVVIGYDHRFGNNREGDLNFLQQYAATAGFEVVEIPAQTVDDLAVSSSKIREALERGDVPLANRLLGQPFSLSGTVAMGDQIGRTIGFPTANIELDTHAKLVPPQGIYAARVGCHKAMLYIGNRPSVVVEGRQVIEVNLIGFTGDLYGKYLSVEVLDFIRPDKDLGSLEALKTQIAADKVEILHRLAQWERVAIVILNYNTRRHMETYLPSVLAHSPGARVVVADNGSPDDSVAWLRANHPEVEVLDLQQNHGFAQGYNEALQRVDADIYVILNSDVEVTAGWMEPILETMRQRPEIAVVQPKILAWRDKARLGESGAGPVRFEYAGAAGGWIDRLGYPFCRGRIFSHSEPDQGQYDTPQACFWAAGAAFFIRADLYHNFGGFDGDYFAHNEEIDLCWRLKRAGYAIWCVPQSVVYHLGGGTLEYENPRKAYLNFRNSLYSLVKNEPWAKLCWLLPARLLLDGLAGARFAAKGQFKAIWSIVRAHGSFYANWSNTLRKRKAVAEAIEQHRIAPTNREGIYWGSIIVAHYLRRVKRFAKLVDVERSAF